MALRAAAGCRLGGRWTDLDADPEGFVEVEIVDDPPRIRECDHPKCKEIVARVHARATRKHRRRPR